MNLLTIKNKPGSEYKISVKKISFNISVRIETRENKAEAKKYGEQFPKIRYFLEVDVNKHSGEDGMPQPVINDIPICYHFKKNPNLKELIGKTIKTSDNNWDWDAWYGNDAPNLIKNKITFLKWTDDNQLCLVWEAQCEGMKESIKIEGAAEFKKIDIQVRNKGDEDKFMKELFKDNIDFNDWIKKSRGYDNPKSKDRWFYVDYLPKKFAFTKKPQDH